MSETGIALPCSYSNLHMAWITLIFIWEYWLGKTKILKPNSTLELIAMIAIGLVKRIKPKDGKDGPNKSI